MIDADILSAGVTGLLSAGHLRRKDFPGHCKNVDEVEGRTLRIATGKFIGGKVVVDGAPLEEGAVVTVLGRDDERGVRLSPEEEAELLLSIAEADRGEMISGEEVLERLHRRRLG